MTAYIMYELKVAVILAAFYLCFKLLLSREKLHRLNRSVLVASAVLAFVLPFCIITLHKTVPVPEAVGSGISGNADAIQALAEKDGKAFPWEIIAVSVYCAGVISVLASLLVGIHRVMKLIRSCGTRELSGTEVLVCNEDIAPFSWMKWIVMSKDDFESGNNHILEHEKAHIRLGHSKDVLFMDIIAAFQWFNPAIWLMKRDLRAIHEYEADDAVLKSGANIKEYQYSLIRKAVSASGYSITNSFNHSILKNRITMMSMSKASVMKGLRVLYILPLICGTLALNARTVIDYESSDNSSVQQKNIKTELSEIKGLEQGYTDSVPVNQTDVKPAFNGGDANQFIKWVVDNLNYPEEAKAAGIQGRVTVQFTVTESGKVADVKVLRGVNPTLDAEAVRVISSSPDWTPGISNGKKVPVTYAFPVMFQTKGEAKSE